MARALGVGIDEFDELRTNPACLYIDKTAYVAALASALLGRQPQIFLARPRRFGKTLLTSTLEALFQGRQDLFAGTRMDREGLWAWDEHRYPVLRLGLGLRSLHSRRALATALTELVVDEYERAELDAPATQSPARMLSRLLRDLQRARNRKVVVLIDEYDTPVTENIDQAPETLQAVLSLLRAFYGALKNARRSIRCVFMTGITRLSKAGLFSGANHFYDITFAPQFNALLGFTHAELTAPAELAADLARCADNIGYTSAEFAEALRAYYNGYRFAEGGGNRIQSAFRQRMLGGFSGFRARRTESLGRFSQCVGGIRPSRALVPIAARGTVRVGRGFSRQQPPSVARLDEARP